MQVFVYEYFTGGGIGELPHGGIAASLIAEATAMMREVAEDFAALPSVRVVSTRDGRLPAFHPNACKTISVGGGRFNEKDAIARLSAESDWTLLIAPETGGELLKRANLVERSGGRLLSPSAAFIEVAADKQLTADALQRAGVPVPRGMTWVSGESVAGVKFPAVIKPIDGCGSQGVRLLRRFEDLSGISSGRWRIEEFKPGLAASVSVLCGPGRSWPLVASEQRLSDDGHFSYFGGRLPLAADIDGRARQLALQAIGALPPAIGYVGVDLVLGDAADGSGDYVIEINPRLTTSYVGLRALSRTNLAAAMLAVTCADEPVLSFNSEPVEFTAAGKITT